MKKYTTTFTWDEDTKQYIGTSKEYPECVVVGYTKLETKRKLEISIENWLKAIRSLESKTKGLKIGYSRASFIVREDLLDNLKEYSSIQKITMKEALEECMTYFFKSKKVRNTMEKL